MCAKRFFASALLATSALAAPTISNSAPAELEKRAEWQEGKCEANVFVDVGGQVIKGWDLHWTVDIIDNPGNQIGHMENVKNPPISERVVGTSKGPSFNMKGEPDRYSSQNALSLAYSNQLWNSIDCYKYTYVPGWEHESGKSQHSWWCQFDC